MRITERDSFSNAFVDEVASLGRQARKVVTADPNARNKLTWRGLTAVKPNRSEAFVAANQPWHEPELEPMQDELLLNVGKKLLKEWNLDHLLITLGEQGMILFDRRPAAVPCAGTCARGL